MKIKWLAALALGALAIGSLSACGGDDAPEVPTDTPAASDEPTPAPEPTDEPPAPTDEPAVEIAGELTVLTHRTDLESDGTMQAYADAFKAKYPGITAVNFEAITAYDDDVSIRLSTGDYGDVLSIPNSVTNDQLSQFFAPIGSFADLAEYRYLSDKAIGDQVYGLAQGGIATGVVYNKRIFEEAGVTEVPTTIDAFWAALEAVKEKTNAIPLYTNAADGWPLGDLIRNMGVANGNANAKNDMTGNDAPWAEGGDAYELDSLIYDAVAKGLTEADPTTTNWEDSKTLIGTGEVACLVLQSWAISQMEAAASDAGADPTDIGFMPVPSTGSGSYAAVLGDRYYAINANSGNKDAAWAWIEFMIKESGYDAAQGFVSTLISAPLPNNLAALTAVGTQLFEPQAAPAGAEGLFDSIDTAAEIGFGNGDYRQQLVADARSGKDKADAFGALNDKWAAARAEVG